MVSLISPIVVARVLKPVLPEYALYEKKENNNNNNNNNKDKDNIYTTAHPPTPNAIRPRPKGNQPYLPPPTCSTK